MSHKHPDRLTRRVRKLEDKQRREMTLLKREVMSALAVHSHELINRETGVRSITAKVNGARPSAEY